MPVEGRRIEINDGILSFYGDFGELEWSTTIGNAVVQGTSSEECQRPALNTQDYDFSFLPYDQGTGIDREQYSNPYIRRYMEDAGSAEQYTYMVHGSSEEQRDQFQRFYREYFGKWTIPDDEQPDIEDERGGALDEFLEKFKPQKSSDRKK